MIGIFLKNEYTSEHSFIGYSLVVFNGFLIFTDLKGKMTEKNRQIFHLLHHFLNAHITWGQARCKSGQNAMYVSHVRFKAGIQELKPTCLNHHVWSQKGNAKIKQVLINVGTFSLSKLASFSHKLQMTLSILLLFSKNIIPKMLIAHIFTFFYVIETDFINVFLNFIVI